MLAHVYLVAAPLRPPTLPGAGGAKPPSRVAPDLGEQI